MSSASIITFGDAPLHWQDVVAVARHGARLELSAAAWARIDNARGIVERIVERGERAYGISTGLGALCNVVLEGEQLAQLSRNTLLSHACGVGEALKDEQTRAIICVAIANYSLGKSGLHRRVVQALCNELDDALEDAIEYEFISAGIDGPSSDVRSVARHEQDRHPSGFYPIVRAIIDLWSLIAAEDGRFFTHNGVDWKAVDQAQKRNEKSGGKKLYGASTITMQCARNVFLWQGRNYVRKALEMYFTYLIEFLWGKKRILEVYINVIEWGDGVYGVEAASEKYFGIPASQLSARQAALLASVLPNPRAWSPATPTAYINRRASMIQGRAGGVSLAPLDLGSRNGSSSTSTTKPKKSRKGE